jgi:hypothetical protein
MRMSHMKHPHLQVQTSGSKCILHTLYFHSGSLDYFVSQNTLLIKSSTPPGKSATAAW